jgi:16S rRNA processing protein RimM
MASDLILVGVFGAPHGVRGELRLKSYTGDPAAIAGYGPLLTADGKTAYALSSVRPVKDDILVVRVKGVDDRDAAARLTNVRLHVPRAALPAPEEEDEFYHADLIGLRVEAADGSLLGTVSAVLDFGAGDIIEIAPADGGRALMLPFTRQAVPLVDIRGGRIVAEPPAETEARPEDGEPTP